MELLELRREIDRIDAELVALFCQRMEVAARIADCKKKNNLPVYHPAREQEVLEKVAELAGAELEGYAKELYTSLFQLSRDYQSSRGAGEKTED